MFGNIEALLKMRNAWKTFSASHPKFSAFLSEMSRGGTPEGTIIEIHMKYPDGHTISSNMRVTASDLELLESMKALGGKQ